jgi:GNAT superfamily N-acetyltransferase
LFKKSLRPVLSIFCLIYLDDSPVGVIDFHKEHPAQGSTYIGLLLLEERHQGIGRAAFDAAAIFARSKLGTSKLVLGVSEEKNVEAFWLKMGFRRNGETYLWKSGEQINRVFEMEKPILE